MTPDICALAVFLRQLQSQSWRLLEASSRARSIEARPDESPSPGILPDRVLCQFLFYRRRIGHARTGSRLSYPKWRSGEHADKQLQAADSSKTVLRGSA